MEIDDIVRREALARILASPRFVRAQRRSRFLRFIAEESFSGRGGELKEYIVGVQAFEKKAESFDPREDSTVRTEATKLRSSLREYYAAEGSNDPAILSLAPGGYQVRVEARSLPEASPPATVPPIPPVQGGKKWLYASLAVFVTVFVVIAAWNFWPEDRRAVVMRPLTAFPGSELRPQISPDGKRVVFAWNGEKMDNFDIYMMPTTGGPVKRLTTNSARDVYSVWSPDGKMIAFARNPGARGSVWVIPADGGAERRIIDGEAFSLCFSPDGREILYVDRESPRAPWRILAVSLATGARRTLTSPPEGILGDAYPAFSPDGKWLAFVRLTYGPASEIFIQAVDGGEAVQLTRDNKNIFGVTWQRQGPWRNSLVFSSDRLGPRSLWSLPLHLPFRLGGATFGQVTASKPERVEGAGEDAMHPFSRGNQMSYQRTSQDFNIWVKDLSSDAPPRVVARSTRWDVTPAISPDAGHLAFASDRSGNMEIWESDLDGENAKQLTNDERAYSRMPQWSPDGKWIAYESRASGMAPAIHRIPEGGGRAEVVAASPAGDRRPMWSADGLTIFFRSMRSGNDGIWKVASKGGAASPFMPGAVEAGETGADLLTCRSGDGLYRNRTLLAKFECDNQWAVGRTAVVWLQNGALHLLDLRSGSERTLPPSPGFAPSDTAPLSISADGRWLAWSNEDSRNTDAILLENVH